MKTNYKILKEDINRFKEIMNYGLIVENIAAEIIKHSLDDVIKKLIASTKDDIMKRIFQYGTVDGGVFGQFLRIVGDFKNNFSKITDDVVKQIETKLGRTLTESEKSSVRIQLEKTLDTSNKELQKSFSKSVDDVIGLDNIKVRSTTGFINQNPATKTTSTALTIIPIEQLDEPAKKIANNIVAQNADEVAKLKQLLPASGQNIAPSNRKFFVDFFGKAKLITDVGGRKFITRRNLLIAAAIAGISYLTLKSDLESEGVTVESDTVDTTSCLGKLEDSTNHPGLKYSKAGFGIMTMGYYYNSGAYYMINPITKEQFPKGSNNYYRFYCQDKTIVKTQEIVDINGKPLSSTGDKTDTGTVTPGGDSYTGSGGWISLGPSYDKQILQALGKNEDRRLTDDDIKELYNKLKSAGKI